MVATGQDAVDEVDPGLLRPGNNGLGREHPDGHRRVADIQRARILAAMFDVVAEHGVANVTVAHIVARSGVSRRTFYELFADREDCFLAAFDDAIERITAKILPAYEREKTWQAKIRAALTGLLEYFDHDPITGRLVIVETLAAGPRVLERRQRVLARLVTIIEQGRDEGKCDEGRSANRRSANGRSGKGRSDDDGDGVGPQSLVAEGVIGGVLSVLHTRMLAHPSPGPAVDGETLETGSLLVDTGSLLDLTGPLTSMIVLPYLGPVAARRELARPVPVRDISRLKVATDPLRDVDMRLTYRTVRVLTAVAESPGSSNRQVGVASGMHDQGQISKLLSRLHRLGLIQNEGVGPAKGAPNAWTLTPKGQAIQATIGQPMSGTACAI